MARTGAILKEAFGLIAARPAAVAIWGLVYLAGSLAVGFAAGLATTGSLTLYGADPYMTQNTMASGGLVALVLIYAGMLLLGAVLMNAVFRAVLRPAEPSSVFMRLGRDELRTAGLIVLVAIVGFVAMVIAQLLLMFFATAITFAAGGGVAAGLLNLALVIGFVCAVVWVEVRLSLLFSLSFALRRISVDAAWELTRGRFWTLFLAYLGVAAILFLLMVPLIWAMMGDYFVAIWQARGDPIAMEAAALQFARQQLEMPVGTRILLAVAGGIIGAIGFALGPGVMASATRILLAERAEAAGDAPAAEELPID